MELIPNWDEDDEVHEMIYGKKPIKVQKPEPKYVIEQDGPKSFKVYVDTGDGMRYQTEDGPWYKRSLKSAQRKGEIELAGYIQKYGGPKARWEGTL